jgi:hypothetical protein
MRKLSKSTAGTPAADHPTAASHRGPKTENSPQNMARGSSHNRSG